MRMLFLLLLSALMASAFSVVLSQHEARALFASLEKMKVEHRELESTFRQLQLDQTASAKHSVVDQVARETLAMTAISPERTLYLKAQANGLDSSILVPVKKE